MALEAVVKLTKEQYEILADGGTVGPYTGIDNTKYLYFVQDDISAGSSTRPVYFSNGSPVACAHSLAADVPSNADFNNYYHKTGSWNGLTYTAGKVGSPDDLSFTIPTGTTSTTVALGNHNHDTRYVRFDTNAQGLNATQKGNARTNIGALSLHGGDADGDFVLNGAGGETITFALDGLIKLQGYGSGDGGGILISSQSGSSAKYARLKTTNLTADRNYEFPNKGGTFAMTTDILNPANYYWADVSVSSSSNKGTTPTVSKITIGGSGSTAGKATMQYNATEDCIDFVFA